MGVTRTVGLANGANIPSAVDANMAEVVALETCFMVVRMVTGEWGVDKFAMDSPRGIDFVTKFGALEGELDLWGNGRRRGGWEWLGVGGRGQFSNVSFQIVGELGHLHLIESGE